MKKNIGWCQAVQAMSAAPTLPTALELDAIDPVFSWGFEE